MAAQFARLSALVAASALAALTVAGASESSPAARSEAAGSPAVGLQSAPKQAERAGIDIGAVIETVSHRVERAQGNGSRLVSEDRLYGAEFGELAPGYQVYPALAFDGTNYLVAWEDWRSGTTGDVYGARVSPAGSLLDPDGIAISTAANDQRAPAVAFDGANYLVVWGDHRSGTYNSDVYGARVSPAGAVLDPSGIAISTAASHQAFPKLAFDGTNYLVAWYDGRSDIYNDIYGARVSPAGSVLDPDGIPISTAADRQLNPALAFDGTNYLVAWTDARSGGLVDIYGARVSRAGVVLDPSGIPISTAADRQFNPALAFDGTNYLVAWGDDRSGASWDIYGARVSPAGAVLDPSGIAISTAAGFQESAALAFDGMNYLVAWSDSRSGDYDIYGGRVSPAGSVLDPNGIAISTAEGAQWYPGVAFDGTNYLVAWGDLRSDTRGDIFGARMSPAGSVLEPDGILISLPPPLPPPPPPPPPPPLPPPPPDTLYDQSDNPGSSLISSQDFETELDVYDDETADDFIIPAGVAWNINGVDVMGAYYNGTGPADSVNVRFYRNGSGNLPDVLVCERLYQPYTGGQNFAVTLSPVCSAAAGHYWVSVQARMDFNPHGQWGWTVRTVQSNAGAAWRNPGSWQGCSTWYRRTICIPTVPDPDQVYRLRGTCLATHTGASCAPRLRTGGIDLRRSGEVRGGL